jgi:hypothetical protein
MAGQLVPRDGNMKDGASHAFETTGYLPATEQRHRRPDQPRGAQVLPGRGWNRALRSGAVLSRFFHAAIAGQDTTHRRMQKRELQRCGRRRHTVTCAKCFDAQRAIQYFGWLRLMET